MGLTSQPWNPPPALKIAGEMVDIQAKPVEKEEMEKRENFSPGTEHAQREGKTYTLPCQQNVSN